MNPVILAAIAGSLTAVNQELRGAVRPATSPAGVGGTEKKRRREQLALPAAPSEV